MASIDDCEILTMKEEIIGSSYVSKVPYHMLIGLKRKLRLLPIILCFLI